MLLYKATNRAFKVSFALPLWIMGILFIGKLCLTNWSQVRNLKSVSSVPNICVSHWHALLALLNTIFPLNRSSTCPPKKIWILKCMLSGCIIIWRDGRNPCGRLRPNISRMVINTHQHTAGQRQMAANRKYELRQSLCAKRKSICILLTRLEIQIQSSSKTFPWFH